jgi:hypothetical protein
LAGFVVGVLHGRVALEKESKPVNQSRSQTDGTQ